MLLLVSVDFLFISIDCCPLSMFLFRCASHSLSLPLSSCLGYIPLIVGLPFSGSLLTRIFSLPTRIMWLSFVCFSCFFCLCLLLCLCLCLCLCMCMCVFAFFLLFVFCVTSWLRCPLMASFLSVSFCLPSLFFSPNVFPVQFGLLLSTL